MGLSRAFIYAGSPSVLVTLWRLADLVARPEMESFYAALKTGTAGKAAALRQAQIEIIRKLRAGELKTPTGRRLVEHPIFWAPFVLIGEAG